MLQEQEECKKEKEKRREKGRNEGKLYAHEVCYGTGQCDKEALKKVPDGWSCPFWGAQQWVITFGGKEFLYPRPKEWVY